MKRLTLLILVAAIGATAWAHNNSTGKMPTVYYPFGTTRNDVIFDLGQPKVADPSSLVYDSYGFHSYEAAIFGFNAKQQLVMTEVTISPDVQEAFIPMNEYLNKIFQHYRDFYESVLGKPYIENKNGFVWKYSDGFALFRPITNQYGLVNFKFVILARSLAKEAGAGSLYENPSRKTQQSKPGTQSSSTK